MIRTTLITLALSGLALAAAAPFAFGATPEAQGVTAGALAKEDKDFLDDAAQGGLTEVKLGELAVKQAGSADVKKFGQRMIDDHSKLDARVADVARDAGVVLPAEPSKKQQDEIDKLTKLTGAKFDQEYMSMMVSDHDHDVKAFEKEAKDGKDAAVKGLAASALPMLHEHLDLAKQTQARIKK